MTAVVASYLTIRMLIGAVFVAQPSDAMRSWVGPPAGDESTWQPRVLVGVRDLGLSAGGFWALRRGGDASPWLWEAAVAESIDAPIGARLSRRRSAPPRLRRQAVLGPAAMAALAAGLAWSSAES